MQTGMIKTVLSLVYIIAIVGSITHRTFRSKRFQIIGSQHLKNIPEFAGGHHEKHDGTGYPKGLTKNEMSVQARIMAIADIFEALTARDRPYKKGKTLSQAMRILGFMKDDAHIDVDLFDIFVKKKIYMKYAKGFLEPEQIDEVSI